MRGLVIDICLFIIALTVIFNAILGSMFFWQWLGFR
jgi:hypothetical protein